MVRRCRRRGAKRRTRSATCSSTSCGSEAWDSAGRVRWWATCSATSSTSAAGSRRRASKRGSPLAQLAPGPLAAQLAIYLGWVHYGMPGATLVAIAFVLPSFLMVLGLSALYVAYGGLPWMRGAFYGIGAAVIAIIARSAYKLARSTIGKDALYAVLFAASARVTAGTEAAGRCALRPWRVVPAVRR